MSFGRFRLLSQWGAGADGVAYRAVDPGDEAAVELRELAAAKADAERWKVLSKRIRLAALLEHPAAVRVREFQCDEPPYLVLDAADPLCLASSLLADLPIAERLELVCETAEILAAAHRLGLAHGQLSPRTVRISSEQHARLDFTATRTHIESTRESVAAENAAARAPEWSPEAAPSAAADVYSLGSILFGCLSGRPLPVRDASAHGQDARATHPADWPFARDESLVRGPLEPSVEASLKALTRQMLAHDPVDRPAVKAVETQLAVLIASLKTAGQRPAAGESGPVLNSILEQTMAGIPQSPAVDQTMEGSGAYQDDELSIGPPGSAMQNAGLLAEPAREMTHREQLGHYRLLQKIGEGGMGAVYRAEDLTDGTVVAIKTMRFQWSAGADALRRFHKEARLLSEVNNPYVANLLEVNEDDGIHYMVLEFVAGQSLRDWIRDRGTLSESLSLAIAADIARALVDAHQRGVVHRDIKPDNVLLGSSEITAAPITAGPESPDPAPTPAPPVVVPRVKLADFGLARHVVESESLNVTQAGSILGTPLYMAPEQFTGGTIDPRTDVYALGATLFHMLIGRPPFTAETPIALMRMHCDEPLMPLKKLNAELSEGVCQIVEKALAKHPDSRYADAQAMLADLERLERGEPTSIIVHPRLPPCDPKNLVRFEFSWQLAASPEQLWPLVSNTERLNRAIGMRPPVFRTEPNSDGGAKRFGVFKKAGITVDWQEHPFEWVEERRFGVLREYTQGPFKWLLSVVELKPRAEGGTHLTQKVTLEPTGMLGRTMAAIEIGVRGKRSLDKVYQRIDAALGGRLGSRMVDPFEEPATLPPARRRRLDLLLDKLIVAGVEPHLVELLGDYLSTAPAPDVARIRPLALARRLDVDPRQLVAACLHGARQGLLTMMWDILCPVCRVPSEVKETLRALREHGQCEACNLSFETDFAKSVELIFRVHPEIRESELGTYCIGGPAHSPHVVAQVRIAPGENLELELALGEGAYRLRGPQLPYALDFRVQATAPVGRWNLNLARGPAVDLPRMLRSGRQAFTLSNDGAHELVARIERTTAREDVLTAAQASTLSLFRELFPGELLSPGQLASVAAVTLLATDLDRADELYHKLGDAEAFSVIHEHFQLLGSRIRDAGGAVIKTVGEGLLAGFQDPAAALRVAQSLAPALDAHPKTRNLPLRAALHRGTAMVATLNDHLDYFGTTVNTTWRLVREARGGELLLSQAVASDPEVAGLLQSQGIQAAITEVQLGSNESLFAERIALR